MADEDEESHRRSYQTLQEPHSILNEGFDMAIAESDSGHSTLGDGPRQTAETPPSSTFELRDNTIGWENDKDPTNPRNWKATKKWATVSIVATVTFIVPLASSMFAPGVSQVMQEFRSTNSLLGALVVSIYILGIALGPLFLAPISEVYGRRIVYTTSNIFFFVFTVACAVASSLNSLIGFRFLAGCAGAVPLAIGGGTIADLFRQEERGLAVSFYTIGPVIGPAVGPVAGGYLSEAKGWRWVFWLITIISGLTTIATFIFMKETYPPKILAQKTRRLQKQTGNTMLRSKLDIGARPHHTFHRVLVRPSRLLLSSPINVTVALASAFMYGITYLLLTTFPLVFEESYGFSTGSSGLTYIGLGVGNLVGLIIFSSTSDRHIKSRSAQGLLQPEDRLPLMIASSPLLAIGLFWYGWSAQARVHWIMPIIGSGIAGLGNILFFLPVIGYLVDAFPSDAASALAANTVLRSIGGALLPLAGRSMYSTLGFGWGNSLLGFVAQGFSFPLWFLYRYGRLLRERYTVTFSMSRLPQLALSKIPEVVREDPMAMP